MATFTYEQFAYRFKNPTVDGNLDLLDDGAIIKIAADDDLQLTHSGSVGDITCSTGALDINAGTVNIKDEASSETMASFVSDGAVTLNHDNTARFATTSAGCEVTGTLAVSGTSAFTGKITSNNGIDIDNINIDGTTIALSSGDLTVDVAGDIILDADGGDFKFQDGGTEILRVSNSSSDVVIKPIVDAKDIIFQQRDGTEVARIEDNGTFNVVTDKLAINGTAVTSTAAELNILDGVTATASELNLLDGDTSVGSSITLVDADGVVVNDGGTMKTIPASDVKTYASGSSATKGFAIAAAIVFG